MTWWITDTSIGQRLKFVRRFRRLTQKELGLRMGYSEKTADVRIAQYEKNARTPNTETTAKFAEVLKVSPAVFSPTICASREDLLQSMYWLFLMKGGGDIYDCETELETMEETLMAMDLGPLLGLFLQSFIVQVTMSALAIIIFVIVYGRMIEIYLMVSLAPIPLSTFGNREQSNIGQNYLRSLFAIGFQGFLIMICVGIYAVLIQSIAFSDDIIGSIWGVMGYTVLLCFTLFKTGSLAKGVFSAH